MVEALNVVRNSAENDTFFLDKWADDDDKGGELIRPTTGSRALPVASLEWALRTSAFASAEGSALNAPPT
jgi:hypothetical protein